MSSLFIRAQTDTTPACGAKFFVQVVVELEQGLCHHEFREKPGRSAWIAGETADELMISARSLHQKFT
jgi:hypothetical protein